MLGIAGATVAGVTFTPAGIVVDLRLRRRKLRCPCGWATRACHARSTRRWRHLDMGGSRLWLQGEVRRLQCRRCRRVRTEQVPWARPGARHSRDFQDVVAWLAQRTDKTTITRMLRVSWEAVARIVAVRAATVLLLESHPPLWPVEPHDVAGPAETSPPMYEGGRSAPWSLCCSECDADGVRASLAQRFVAEASKCSTCRARLSARVRALGWWQRPQDRLRRPTDSSRAASRDQPT
jgi:hypothetical protein